MTWFLMIAFIVLLDQVSKYLIVTHIEEGSMHRIINGLLYISLSRNTGAAWGIFQNGRLFFIPMTILTSAVICYFLVKNRHTFLRLSLSCILGGAIGNLIDRIFRKGEVVDFIYIPPVRVIFPNFNVADTFIFIGTCMLAYYLFFIYQEKA